MSPSSRSGWLAAVWWAAVSWAVVIAVGCAHTGAPGTARATVGPQVAVVAAGSTEDGPPPRALSPLTSDELALRGELEKEVGALAELGPRSLAHTWNLYSATDHLARRLEILGHQVVRLGFPVGDEVLQNLEVIVPGRTAQTLVVAAHYDTSAESPGVNASASGAAVLLTLAKQLAGRPLERSLRMVWLCNEVPGTVPPGSAVYAKHVQQAQVPVVATLTLGSLGYYSLASGSQRYPEDLLYGAETRTHFADFIAVLSNAASNGLLEHVRPVLSAASLPVEELILPDSAPLAADGPQARFWSAGLLGLALTDTAQFRSQHFDDPLDTLDKLDFDRLARVAKLLDELVMSIAGARVSATP
ncbi:MAG: M28 family peptidase [Deltaproteobacteria bacterium]